MESTPVRIDELLAHAGWVRSLAARLVRDPGTAEDVAQEVWASALRSPPRERSNLRGWLGAAVRSAARSMQRGDSRRRAREELAREVREQADPAELVERAQLHRELVEHVIALDEPHRSMVLAHWFEGSTVAAAGRRLGLSERVAKLRLDAAHELLRKRLDARHGGRAAWSVVFLGWTRSHALDLAAAGSGGVLALGGIAMATKLIMSGVAATVLASMAWFLWPRDEAAEPARAQSVASGGQDSTRLSDLANVTPIAPADARAAVKAPLVEAKTSITANQKPQWLVRGRVSGGPVGSLAQTRLTAEFIGAYNIQNHGESMATKDGAYEIDVTAAAEAWMRAAKPAELLLTSEHPLCLRSEARTAFASAVPDPTDPSGRRLLFHCDIELTTAAVVTGRVIVPNDWTKPGVNEVERVQLGLYEGGTIVRNDRGTDYTYCDPTGRWTLRANHSGDFTVVVLGRELRPETRVATLAVGSSTGLDPIELGWGASISGTVLRAGRPVGAGSEVVAEPKEKSRIRFEWSARTSSSDTRLEVSGNTALRTYVTAHTDGAGRYHLDGLEPDDYEIHVQAVAGHRMSLGGVRPRVERVVRAPQGEVDLELLPPLVHLSFAIDGRAPLAGELDEVQGTIVPEDNKAYVTPLSLHRCLESFGAIQVAPDVAYEFRVAAGHFDPVIVFVPALAMNEERDVRMNLKTREGTCTLVVRLLTAKPGEVPTAAFKVFDPLNTSEVERRSITRNVETDGTFVLSDLPSGRNRVRVTFPDTIEARSTPYLATEFDVDLPPGKIVRHELQLEVGSRLRLSAKDERGGFVRSAVELRDARDDKIETEFYCQTAGTTYGCGWYLCEQGINDHPPLPAGHYELKLTADGFEDKSVSLDLIQGETTTLEIPMRHR